MKFRVLFTALALLALSTFAFAQPASVAYYYPGDPDPTGYAQLTYGECWSGTVIPDGSDAIFIFFVRQAQGDTTEWDVSYLMNGMDYWGMEGYFFMEYYAGAGFAIAGDLTWVEVRYEGCTYRSFTHTLGAGANDIWMPPDGWESCECEAPPEECDLGDLGPPYPTAPHPAGPCHLLSGIAWLGQGITAEAVPNVVDLDACDDGVVFNPGDGPNGEWLACTPVSVTVTVSGPFTEPVYLSAWKDGNLDGDFDDVLCDGRDPEWIIQDALVPVAGVYNYTFNDPGLATLEPYTGIFRFRLSSAPMGAAWWTGGHDELGEVEDYYIEDLQLPVELADIPVIEAGDRQLTLSFPMADELNVDAYEIMRDGVKIAELPVADGSYTYVDENLQNGRRYEYSIVAVGLDQRKELSYADQTVWAGAPSFTAGVVTEYALYQNYPNPFNPATEIVYDVREQTHVTLKVYNVMGQVVATLVDEMKETGRYPVTFDATGLTSGLYFYTVTMDNFTATKKMLLVQ
jgi:hypothetical protein